MPYRPWGCPWVSLPHAQCSEVLLTSGFIQQTPWLLDLMICLSYQAHTELDWFSGLLKGLLSEHFWSKIQKLSFKKKMIALSH